MKKIIALIVLVFLTVNILAQSFTQQRIRFQVDDKEEILKITRLISIDKVIHDTVYAYVTGKQLQDFKEQTSYSFEFIEPGVSTKNKVLNMAGEVSEMSNWDRYPTYEVYVEMMNQFEADYPGLCRVESIGTTVDGRELLVAKISDNVNTEEDEPEFFYTSTMHGDEATGYILMLRMIDSLLTTYSTSAEIKSLVDNIEIYINPNANPDGTYMGGNSTVSGATRYNSNGVDINRDFPDPIDGDNSPWQPETQAMMNFAENHTIAMSANFHGGAEVANYPWDGTSRAHADETWLKKISYIYVNSVKDNGPAGYFTSVTSSGVTNGYDWYAIYGGRQDYMTYFHHGREVTMEISNTKLVSSDELPNYWKYNREALFLYMKECLYGIRGIVTNDLGQPLKAKIEVLNHDTEEDQSYEFTDPDVGDYHRMIEDGTYDLAFSCEGHYPDTVRNITAVSGTSTRVDVSLTRISKLTADKSSINKSLVVDSATQVLVKINREGHETLTYDAAIENAATNSWVAVNPTNGTISDETDSLYVEISAYGMDAGIYNTNLIITDSKNQTITIPVELVVNTEEVFMVSPDSLISSSSRFDTIYQSFQLTNIIYSPVSFTLALDDSSYADYISFDVTEGTLPDQDIREIQMEINPEGLALGKHELNVVVADTGDFLLKLPVHFTVHYKPVLKFSVDSLEVTIKQEEKDTASFTIYNQSPVDIQPAVHYIQSLNPWIEEVYLPDTLLAGDSALVDIYFTSVGQDTGTYLTHLEFTQDYDDSLEYVYAACHISPREVTGLEPIQPKAAVSIYPNPFTDELSIQFDTHQDAGTVNVRIYDLTGRLLQHKAYHNLESGTNELRMRIENAHDGQQVLFLKVEVDNQVYTKKIIKH